MYFFMASSSKKFWTICHQTEIYFILQGDYEWCFDLWGRQHEVAHKRKKPTGGKGKEIHSEQRARQPWASVMAMIPRASLTLLHAVSTGYSAHCGWDPDKYSQHSVRFLAVPRLPGTLVCCARRYMYICGVCLWSQTGGCLSSSRVCQGAWQMDRKEWKVRTGINISVSTELNWAYKFYETEWRHFKLFLSRGGLN